MDAGFAAARRVKETVDQLIDEKGIPGAGGELGVAALLYTYKCTIACGHCCFGCGAARPSVRMTVEQGVRHLAALHELGRVIHIAGGECMVFWDDLRDLLLESARAGVGPQFIETNCSFAVDDRVVRERLEFMRGTGVRGVLFSSDPYHQAFVPAANVLRFRRIARDIFGDSGVWGPLGPDDDIRDNERIAADPDRLAECVRRHPPIFVGAAYLGLRQYVEDYALDEMPFNGGWRHLPPVRHCAMEFQADTIWELHVDPYDNVQTNCGIILANASKTRMADLLKAGPESANPIVRLVSEDGPFALARFARDQHGYVIPERACSKCALCYHVRTYLRPFYPEILGPAEVYGV